MNPAPRLLTRLKHRWDISPAERSGLSFRATLALINLRRVELACLLALVNDLIALALGHHYSSIVLEIVLLPMLMAVASLARRRGSLRLQEISGAAIVLCGLLLTQITVVQVVGRTGLVPAGYSIRLLTTTLLFVFPPRSWALLMALVFSSYTVLVTTRPITAGAQTEALVYAAILTTVSLLTGWLIHASRQSDHQQRALIETQNARLAAQNAELDQIMAIAAHDLRSPLHGLRNLFDLAARRAGQDPTLPLRVLHDGISSLDAMLALVNRLLQAHQAEHGPLADVIEGDLREQVQAAARRIAPQAEAQAVTVRLSLPDAPLAARFDAGALAQILDNLLANAVRFTPGGQALHLTARAAAGEAVLAVQDRGPGIDPASRPALFRKFQRGIHARGEQGSDGKTGTGMGLFIAATYAARLGATLSYRPAEPGGSVFELALPLTAGAAAPSR